LNPEIALALQIVISILILYPTYLILYKTDMRSIKIGTIFTFVIFLIFDAFPIIELGWGKKGGALPAPVHIHHSTIGIIGVIFFMVYLLFLRKCPFFQYLEKTRIPYILLWISLLFISSQLHEILYFGKLIFPDRGFPIKINI